MSSPLQAHQKGLFCSKNPPGAVVPSRGLNAGGGVEAAPLFPGGTATILRPVWTPRRLEVGCWEPAEDAKPLMQLGSAEMLRVEQEPPCPQRPLWPQGIIATAWGSAEQDPALVTSCSQDLGVLPAHPRRLLLFVAAHLEAPTVRLSMPHVRKKKHKDMKDLKRNGTELRQGVKEASKDRQRAWPWGRGPRKTF